MNSAKIRLSAEELLMISDPEWILTKNRILMEVNRFLSTIQQSQQQWLETCAFPEPVLRIPAKISQGENYQGLPYRVLDFPRCFEGDNIFAVRTLFWWGHFFSVTLHLSGRFRTACENNLLANREQLIKHGTYICTDPDPWQHHFEKGYYTVIEEMTEGAYKSELLHKPFIKLACKHSLSGWEELPSRLLEDFKGLICAAGYGH